MLGEVHVELVRYEFGFILTVGRGFIAVYARGAHTVPTDSAHGAPRPPQRGPMQGSTYPLDLTFA